jgi:hypothetical protein
MFRILLFIIAAEPVGFVLSIGLSQLFSGKVSESLSSLAISVMCISYFLKGISEVISNIRKLFK